MKVTVGVECSHQGMELINFLQALNFDSIALQLCYVLEMGAHTGVYGSGFDLSTGHLSTYFQQLKAEGNQTLQEVAAHAREHGLLASDVKLLLGSVSNELMSFAENTGSELLLVGPIQRIALDSTSRKAAINSRQCALIVKNPPLLGKKSLTVVCATDHSPYSNQCLEKFFEWHPRGISHATILSVYSDETVKLMTRSIEHFKADASAWIHDALTKENDRLIEKFNGQGITFENRVESGSVGDTIAQVMSETGADLLILGSQGHGFMERLTIGSISLDQVVNRPYSVLIMRSEQKTCHTKV